METTSNRNRLVSVQGDAWYENYYIANKTFMKMISTLNVFWYNFGVPLYKMQMIKVDMLR